jgi:hypothetical protein
MDNPRDGLDDCAGSLGGFGLSLLSRCLGLRGAGIGLGRSLVIRLSIRCSLSGLLSQKVVAPGIVATGAIPSARAKECGKDRGIDDYLGH